MGDELFLHGARSQEECPCQTELVLTPPLYILLFVACTENATDFIHILVHETKE